VCSWVNIEFVEFSSPHIWTRLIDFDEAGGGELAKATKGSAPRHAESTARLPRSSTLEFEPARLPSTMGKTRSPALVPAHPTRRNTASDRKAGAGSVPGRHPGLKRGGAGFANWGRAGDELWDEDAYDTTEPSAQEALATAVGLEWSEVDDLSDEDKSNMDALEEAMREDWLTAQSSESQEVADDAEEFFNSLDPRSWVE